MANCAAGRTVGLGPFSQTMTPGPRILNKRPEILADLTPFVGGRYKIIERRMMSDKADMLVRL
jgi:hypothetical protein